MILVFYQLFTHSNLLRIILGRPSNLKNSNPHNMILSFEDYGGRIYFSLVDSQDFYMTEMIELESIMELKVIPKKEEYIGHPYTPVCTQVNKNKSYNIQWRLVRYGEYGVRHTNNLKKFYFKTKKYNYQSLYTSI